VDRQWSTFFRRLPLTVAATVARVAISFSTFAAGRNLLFSPPTIRQETVLHLSVHCCVKSQHFREHGFPVQVFTKEAFLILRFVDQSLPRGAVAILQRRGLNKLSYYYEPCPEAEAYCLQTAGTLTPGIEPR
jgi:hypothetical protein